MAPTRRRYLAATAGALALAGCTSDDGSTETDDPTPTDDGAAPTATADATPTPTAATVQVREHEDYGRILVDADGMTLYMFDSDTKGSGASTCSGGCLEAWPALTVEGTATAGADVTASLSTFEREDGRTQVAAAGWPLYYYASDGAPGDATGQGVSDVWWVLDPSGSPIRSAETAAQPGGGY